MSFRFENAMDRVVRFWAKIQNLAWAIGFSNQIFLCRTAQEGRSIHQIEK